VNAQKLRDASADADATDKIARERATLNRKPPEGGTQNKTQKKRLDLISNLFLFLRFL
jgi:hypothetical protein